MVANFAGFNRVARDRVAVIKGTRRSGRNPRGCYYVELSDGSLFVTPGGQWGFGRLVEACRALRQHTGLTHYRRLGRIFRLSGESCDVD